MSKLRNHALLVDGATLGNLVIRWPGGCPSIRARDYAEKVRCLGHLGLGTQLNFSVKFLVTNATYVVPTI